MLLGLVQFFICSGSQAELFGLKQLPRLNIAVLGALFVYRPAMHIQLRDPIFTSSLFAQAEAAAKFMRGIAEVAMVRPSASVWAEEQLHEAGVRFDVFLFGRHCKTMDEGNSRGLSEFLHEVVVFVVVLFKSILVRLQSVGVAWNNLHEHAVLVVVHVAQRCLD